ncbi:hypothetical protein BT63DRAFT_319407 [Microthyrium microscopicum]|uniref:ABM domain-containing protein n=1 Tax=Microthyrium microscopicum TaxID=703497 RepID=A0A6A6U3T2_9PEZI|nr:hypothetical protein BT63DRAFT_319407 [Microthyrium microscopicum]
MDAVFIVAIIKPKEGKLEEVQARVKGLAEIVEKEEPECVSYGLFTNEKEGTIVIIERYKDQAAAEAHRNTPHFAEAIKAGDDWLAEPTKVYPLSNFGGFSRGS